MGGMWEVCGCRNVCVVVRGEVMVDVRARGGDWVTEEAGAMAWQWQGDGWLMAG